MIIFVKLGGSLITDKTVESSYREQHAVRLAHEMQRALTTNTDLQLLIGHGSGSFGHFAASRYGTIRGVHTAEQWRGFSEVARAAAELNYRVTQSLAAVGLPIWRLQPSASALCQDGELVEMAIDPIRTALAQRLVPLVYGDVAVDRVRGGTITSTETIFAFLAAQLSPQKILLLGEVPGVLDATGQIIPQITPASISDIQSSLGGSAGTDVTGGMISKVTEMLSLTQRVPGLEIRILDGREPGLLEEALIGQSRSGTLIFSP